ncbi:tyrosine-type recombinase/integrase [Paeniglutamicibacter cryotolerans]|uniref:Site-specific recombinase XerD n=1 Tax=Paeniglutamicibacter cryotolerans TaxID=670079 RepID=A0A839QLX7_9MICC|nr:tyrosine-type recombinase/integrase [Paeniglutamicibacter cryotolerans]MBB2996780.1 site-specific recombinase XerD [Paeniglutamicibacter cryotolerans]
MTVINATLQSFFTDRLTRQKDASSHTIAAYRDTLRLLLVFAAATHKVPASSLQWDQLDATEITAFLEHLQHDRGNSARTRNARLSAIHSLFRYAALHHPEHAASIARVLAIPPQRVDRHLVDYLTDSECEALLAAPDRSTWTGRRDYTFLVVAVQTGLRVSELIGLTVSDIHLGAGAHVSCRGKGRKDRITPLTRKTVTTLRDWAKEKTPTGSAVLFPTRAGRHLSRDAIEHRIKLHTRVATGSCPSLADKHVSAHVLRHTAAMRLLHAGIDTSVIALWLGHKQVDTTQIYITADLKVKEDAIDRTRPLNSVRGRYRRPDNILAWLGTL